MKNNNLQIIFIRIYKELLKAIKETNKAKKLVLK